jgi:hypothetical protein
VGGRAKKCENIKVNSGQERANSLTQALHPLLLMPARRKGVMCERRLEAAGDTQKRAKNLAASAKQ